MQVQPRPLDTQVTFEPPKVRIPTMSSRRGFSEYQSTAPLGPTMAHRQYNPTPLNNDYNTQIFIQQIPNIPVHQQ